MFDMFGLGWWILLIAVIALIAIFIIIRKKQSGE